MSTLQQLVTETHDARGNGLYLSEVLGPNSLHVCHERDALWP